MPREGVLEINLAAHKRAARLKRRVQPLMRIDGQRIRFTESMQFGGRIGNESSHGAISTIDVKPEIEVTADGCKLVERIDCACAHRAGGSDHQKRLVACLEIFG